MCVCPCGPRREAFNGPGCAMRRRCGRHGWWVGGLKYFSNGSGAILGGFAGKN